MQKVAVYPTFLSRENEKIRRYKNGEFSIKKVFPMPEDDDYNFFSITHVDGDEKSPNIFKRADEYTLHLIDEYISDHNDSQIANLKLLRKMAKDGTIKFNFRREYATASSEVENWINANQECGACLYALTLSC